MGMRLSEHRLQAASGERVALVVTPAGELRIGRDRLKALRMTHEGGDTDREILENVRAHAGEDRIVVFRGRAPDGRGSWGFAADLDDDERAELGYHLVASEVPTYRRLVAAGVFALIHVEWGAAEVQAYRAGTERLLDELEASSVPEVEADPAQVAVSTIDRYILRHLTSFYEDGFEEVVRSVLLAHLATFEQQIPHFRAMVRQLPASAL